MVDSKTLGGSKINEATNKGNNNDNRDKEQIQTENGSTS